MSQKNKNLITIAIVTLFIAVVLIGGVLFYIREERAARVLTAQQVAEKAIDLINQHYLLGPGVVASLISVVEENGLYRITLEAGGEKHVLYTNKDGEFLFFQATERAEEKRRFSTEQLKDLAKCLNQKGVKFFGTYWCGWCQRQKELFREAARYLPYIECDPNQATEAEFIKCQEAGVGPVPDWRFPDGIQKMGLQSIERLAGLSGCPLAPLLIIWLW